MNSRKQVRITKTDRQDQTDRQTDSTDRQILQTYIQTDRQTDRHEPDRQTDRQTDRQNKTDRQYQSTVGQSTRWVINCECSYSVHN